MLELLLGYQGSRTIETLFADWVTNRGDWTQTTAFMQTSQTVSKSKIGREVYIKLRDLIKKEGRDEALEIYHEKKRLQSLLPKDSDEDPYWLPHPELPGNQAEGSERMGIYTP